MKKSLAIWTLACFVAACAGEAPTDPLDTDIAFQLVDDGPLPYSVFGDCVSRFDIVDPGTVRFANGLQIIQGLVFDCLLTGDITGTIRITWNNAVFGPGPEAGHVAGKSTLFVESFFGREDLEGTFEGPFSASVADLLFGESSLSRTGTGDFSGVVMHGVFFQDPPASNITTEIGTIVGN